MKRVGLNFVLAGLLVCPTTVGGVKAATNTAPAFEEVIGLVREHLAGSNEKEINRAAVQGLISQLYPRVSIVTNTTKPVAETKPVGKTSLFDGPIGYVRIARVSDGLAKDIRDAHHELNTTNKLTGLVFDLRFANGDDYGAAAEVADLFCAKERPLLDFGKGMNRSKSKSDALKIPVAVLVNHQTASAAEALASVLREIGAGLIIGTNTAGQAALMKNYDLTNGGQLRIATSMIKLGDGTAVSMRGVKPDIEVAVAAADEKAYLADPFADLQASTEFPTSSLSSTNSANTNRVRRRISEANLVRARRDGASVDELPEREEPEKLEVRDVALARALDVLKGLAVVKQFRPN